MAVRDILVCLDSTAAGKTRLELAFDLARTNKSHLIAVYTAAEVHAAGAAPIASGLPPTVLGPVSPDGARVIGGEPLITDRSAATILPEAEQAAAIEQCFHQELSLRAVEGEWFQLSRNQLRELVQLAKTVDLTVLGQFPGNDSEGMTWLRPDDVLIDIGRPVLVVPCAGTIERLGTRVLIAWDATREANRALHDALPLLAGEAMVTVIHVGAHQADLDRDRPWLERVIRHLARYGINAQAEELLHSGAAIHDALLSRAAALGADMIVAGAYHHSPLREGLLGGVSRALLAHMTIPVLMSH